MGSTLSASRPAIELPVRTRLVKALRRFRQLEDMTLLQFLFSAPNGKRIFWLLPWLVALRRRWTAVANLMILRRTKQKAATALLRDKLYEQDFAGPISLRASRILGPISRFRIVEILPHMKLVSRAARPGLTVGFLRILCNGLCTAQRFHTEGEEQMCRVGCPDEPDSLAHNNECPLLCTFVVATCTPLVPSSTRALQLGICRKEVFASLGTPRRSRCLAKGALQSLPPSHWHQCLSPARHCSH